MEMRGLLTWWRRGAPTVGCSYRRDGWRVTAFAASIMAGCMTETGQCVEQPAEPKPFANKIKIGGYPTRDYLGLVFAYLGPGDPPPFPRYPDFEEFEGLFEIDSYSRACNFFNNLENGGDVAHVGFVHRGREGSYDGTLESPTISAEEDRLGDSGAHKAGPIAHPECPLRHAQYVPHHGLAQRHPDRGQSGVPGLVGAGGR